MHVYCSPTHCCSLCICSLCVMPPCFQSFVFSPLFPFPSFLLSALLSSIQQSRAELLIKIKECNLCEIMCVFKDVAHFDSDEERGAYRSAQEGDIWVSLEQPKTSEYVVCDSFLFYLFFQHSWCLRRRWRWSLMLSSRLGWATLTFSSLVNQSKRRLCF